LERVNASDLVPGMAIAAEVTSADGMLKLLESGTRLTKGHIARIRSWGVPLVTIDNEAAMAKTSGRQRTKSEFLAIYTDTVNTIVDAFRDFEKIKEVPVMRMRELAEQRIPLLVETVGAIGFLYNLQCHSQYTFRHSLDVAVIAGILGKWLGSKGKELKDLILAGLLHDVGKLTVPSAILEKPGALSPEEFAIVRRHSREGYRLVKESGQVSSEVELGILHHHERLDGSGYPAGLIGGAICAQAEVIAIADIYDAMTSDRAYRRKATPLVAMEAIATEMFTKLNPVVAMTFLDNMRDRLTGCRVSLDNGQKAKIIGFNARNHYFTKPVGCTEEGEIIDLYTCKIGIKEVG